MGTTDDFDAFYAARASQLVRHIYLATGDVGRAQECVQEAFLRAWQRWDRLQGDDPVQWVRTVAWRLAMNDWRRSLRQARALMRLGSETQVPPPSAEVLAVRDALAKLPADQRTVLVLHYFEDLTVRNISDLLGLPEGTVKARLSRGRAAMNLVLGGDDEVELTWIT